MAGVAFEKQPTIKLRAASKSAVLDMKLHQQYRLDNWQFIVRRTQYGKMYFFRF